VYSQWQYGGLVRFDKKSGNRVDIKPKEKAGNPANRFNWDAPLLISNFNNKRLYFASQYVYKSDDQGNSWQIISPDLSRGIDRNKLPIMDRYWGVDGIAINASTSIYGNITALAESPKNEKLLYAGTDDGLIHVTQDGGATWTKIEKFTGVPNQVLVHNIYASRYDENVVYAVFNNHRSGDFKPYILKSSDKGKTWTDIGKGLPERGSAYCMAEDHKNANLLFVGTELGVFFTLDGGVNWMQLKSGLPTICIRDMAIQERENDLVLGTFGRGFYVLDDYSVLQTIQKSDLDKKAVIFPIKPGLIFIPSEPIGDAGSGSLGASFYTAPNPKMGVNFTYFLQSDYKSIKEIRKEAEAKKIEAKQPIYFPSADSIRLEDNEESPYLLVVIKDTKGEVIRKMKQPATKGMYRINWSGRMDVTTPISANGKGETDYGPIALPGEYTVQIMVISNANIVAESAVTSFSLNTLDNNSTKIDNEKLQAFYTQLGDFRRVVLGTNAYKLELENRMNHIKVAIQQSAGSTIELIKDVNAIEKNLLELTLQLDGDVSLSKRDFATIPGFIENVEYMVWNVYSSQLQETKTHQENLASTKIAFKTCYQLLLETKDLIQVLERKLDVYNLPYTPGRLPKFD
jgi:hypothetical protein